MTPAQPRPEISVVTPTHNRPASLLRLLRALRDGRFPAERFEVVVVADGCSDDTAAIARAEPLPFAVRVLEQTPGRGAAAARNLGASHATGDILVFLDDDIEPGPALLTEHHRAHTGAGGAAVVIGPPLPVRPPSADLGTIAAWAWWEGQFARMRQPGHRFSYDEVFSGNFSMPAALFSSVGGCDVEFNNGRDDSELGLRLIYAGARVCFAQAASGWHHELRDHPRLILRKRAEGKADVRLARLHPELWPVLRISWPQLPPWSPLGLLRRAALTAPGAAELLLDVFTRALPLLERLRLRGTWRKVQAGVMYGWYWRGIAEAVGGPDGLRALREECLTRTLPPPAPLVVDLAQGLEAAERQIDEAKPAAVLVQHGVLEVGLIPARPGAEPLRGEHLRPALATELPHALIAVMSTAAAAGHPRVPHPGTLRGMGSRPAASARPPVSVVIAAHNAGHTLAEALGSLVRQTHTAWEATVVDDGSTDDTAAITERLAAQDPRIRLVRQEHLGPGAARNAGIGASRHPWLLFLDADDWLLPRALERLCEAATTRAAVDAVHGGWARVTSMGVITATEFAPPESDLFPRFAEACAFPIHACLFRRELVARVGGFDPALGTCEDWDFWQRLTRSGTRFARLDEKVAHYRMQLGTGATATDRLLPDGLAVIGRGHQRDLRVRASTHAEGAPSVDLPAARLRFAAWVAGLRIGRGDPVDPVLRAISEDVAPGLNPVDIAGNLCYTVPLAVARGSAAWDELWPRVAEELAAFLDALERQSGAWRLARRSMLALERLTLDVSSLDRPFRRGSTMALEVEITRPIDAITVPDGVERVHCRVLAEGVPLGTVLLPACDGAVTARVLADAIAAALAWPILGRYFAATRYPELEFVREAAGVAVHLGGAPLAPPAPDAIVTTQDGLHDLIGWPLLLQEVWGVPGFPLEEFYRSDDPSDQAVPMTDLPSWPVVEISTGLPRFRSSESSALVEVRAGGVPFGLVRVASDEGTITPARQRATITTEAGFELCRVVVREAILGRGFEGGRLRTRLKVAAEQPWPALAAEAELECVPASATGRLAPDWRRLAGAVACGGTTALALARYNPAILTVSAGRRASLPSAVRSQLTEAASLIGPPAVSVTGMEPAPCRVEYLPELLWVPAGEPAEATTAPAAARGAGPERPYDRHHFESLFVSGTDPWSYDTPYEQLKYQQTLALLPEGGIGAALELACAEGRFTRLLAPRVERLIAADFSEVALQRAAQACTAPNVHFQRLDLATDPFPGQFDLIVCSEVLYFLGSLEALHAVGDKFVQALLPGGRLVLAHANLQVDAPDQPGFDWPFPYGARIIGETLGQHPLLDWVREVRTDAYRIQLFQRRQAPPAGSLERGPAVVERAPYQPPEPQVAARFRAAGSRGPLPSEPAAGHATVPILMYHSIASAGPSETARYRVSPELFAAQLAYLHDAGFSTISIHQWLAAARARRPLPDRSVLLTFDDGYLDFADVAWPLLRRHGFGALVFLVADLIGRTNEWDAALGEPVPLMDRDRIERLASEGVEFGAHGATRRPMTGLSPAEIAGEAIRSRRVLGERLGRPVRAFAYPHGDTDAVVQHLVGACGFQAGFTCREARAGFRDSPLTLPRIEIAGGGDLAAFIARLGR